MSFSFNTFRIIFQGLDLTSARSSVRERLAADPDRVRLMSVVLVP